MAKRIGQHLPNDRKLAAALRQLEADGVAKEHIDKLHSDVLAARKGNFMAYLRVNGFVTGSTIDMPEPLLLDETTRDIVGKHFADLRCAKVEVDAEGNSKTVGCGKWHGQDIHGLVAGPDGQPRLKPVKCPHCGLEDCAGPLKHADVSAKEDGKTEIVVAHGTAFRMGRTALFGRKPDVVMIGANVQEAEKRLSKVREVLARPWHGIVFGTATVPKKKHPASRLQCLGWGGGKEGTVLMAYGALGVPNGLHAGHILWDDGCTLNTSLVKPAEGEKVAIKFKGTVYQGSRADSAIDVLGNVCVAGDLNDFIIKHAKREAALWTVRENFAGCPEDGPDFKSHCPTRFSRERLAEIWRMDEREYRRVYMGQPFSPDEIVFRTISFWISKERFEKLAAEEPGLGAVVMQQKPALMPYDTTLLPWPCIIGVDLGFTGVEASNAMKKGRSKTGIVTVAIDPATKWIYVLDAFEDWVGAGEHLSQLLPRCERFRTQIVAVEHQGAQKELVATFERAGLTVYPYDPSTLGSKTFRKLPIAEGINHGKILLGGHVTDVTNHGTMAKGTIVCFKSHQVLYDALKIFPAAEGGDVRDALEIACRTAWQLEGQFPDDALPPDRLEASARIPAWRRRLDEPPPEPGSDMDLVDERCPDELVLASMGMN